MTSIDKNQHSSHAYAEFIVRACNSHNELLAALKALVARIEEEATVQREGVTGGAFSVSLSDHGVNWADDFNAAEVAIAKAEGRDERA